MYKFHTYSLTVLHKLQFYICICTNFMSTMCIYTSKSNIHFYDVFSKGIYLISPRDSFSGKRGVFAMNLILEHGDPPSEPIFWKQVCSLIVWSHLPVIHRPKHKRKTPRVRTQTHTHTPTRTATSPLHNHQFKFSHHTNLCFQKKPRGCDDVVFEFLTVS